MNIRLIRILIASIVSVIFCVGCQRKSIPASEALTNKIYRFPLEWLGEYEGTLNIINAQQDTSAVKMQLKIGTPDASGYYPWILIYDDKDIRSYGLEAINTDQGHYRIDEFNSISIDGFLRGNHFISRFDVLGTDLVIDYERNAEGIKANLYITKSDPLDTNGGEIIAQDTVPIVHTYKVGVFQTAQLYKLEQ